MAANLPTYGLNATTVAARNPEYNISGQFAGGANEAGSCAPGIGINTGNKEPKLDDWTVLDQAGAARTPQDTQHIGGNALGAGDQSTHTVKAVQGADINDTLSYIEAVVQAAPGAGMGAAGADPINRTDETVEIGERCWGTNTVV